MITAQTIVELFRSLPTEEQEKCRHVIMAAPVPGLPKIKRQRKTILRPEHATPELIYAETIRELGIKFIPINQQAINLVKF